MLYYEHTIEWTPGRIANAYAGANGDPNKESKKKSISIKEKFVYYVKFKFLER